MSKGFVYILTNESMPNWVKIGETEKDVEKRAKELSSKTAVPLSFRVYAFLETDESPKIIEGHIHYLLDLINPGLRAIETNKIGKDKKREFFQVAPETAYRILERVAAISKNSKVPVKPEKTLLEQEESDIAHHRERKPISFEELKIPMGAELEFSENPSIKCKVIDNRRVLYEDEQRSLSGLARELLNSPYPVQGTVFWKYEGETLWDRRLRMEKEG